MLSEEKAGPPASCARAKPAFHVLGCGDYDRERISCRMNIAYPAAKQSSVAATSPVTCGQTSSRLWPSGNRLGIVPTVCSTVSGPSARTDGSRIVAVASLYK